PRSCPGSNISRLEQMIAWEKLCDAFAGLAYAPGNDFRHQGGIMLGIYRLLLNLAPA
ncbi:MAG: cytochrome P450, partial [Erythrobacter sp.]|nr:cytochrome P450 [Erythrobacter sp.]